MVHGLAIPHTRAPRLLAPSNIIRLQRRLLRGAVCLRAIPKLVNVPKKGPTGSTSLSSVASLSSLELTQEEECTTDEATFVEDYAGMDAWAIVKERTGWLAIFGVGLILAAGVVEEFDDLISKHVELSFFVPLIMGHGGNTGSQTTCAVIRALAVRQVCFSSVLRVVAKEAVAGFVMGSLLGASVFGLSLATHAFSAEVGLIVAISLPVVSLWANSLGAFLTLASAKVHLDPAMTSAPLVTTIVDTTGLVIYFIIASAVMSKDSFLAQGLALVDPAITALS